MWVAGFPPHPYQRGQPSALLPSPSRTGRTGSSQSPGQRRGEGQGPREAAPSLPVAPPFRPDSEPGRAPPGPGAVQPVRPGGAGAACLAAYLVLIITQSW